MNLKYERSIPFFLALTLSICLFIVVDIAYDEQIWEFSPFTLKARIQSFSVTIVSFYLASYLFRRIAHSFINRSKDEKKANWKEYVFVFLINLILLNVMHIFILVYITHWEFNDTFFKWKESALINVMGSVLLFLYYMLIRNKILFKSFIKQNYQLEKEKVDRLETELKFLKSQYHPHFLFNALNTIYAQVDEKNEDAKQSIEQLSHLLRYQLYNRDQEVTMEQEIDYLKSYIAFQRLRTSERLVMDVYFDQELKGQKIHPLLFQPLIENAFKYVRGEYKIQLEMKLNGNEIHTEIRNSISQSQNTSNKKGRGIGLENLKRRLDLLYPDKYVLKIEQTENMFIARLTINTN